LRGELRVPGDKSISHGRDVCVAADGVSRITGFLEGEDTRATARAFVQMGVRSSARRSERIVHGVGLHGLRAPEAPVDCGNAGTGMRLLADCSQGSSSTRR
jgi:3-phosphoshikimate 1-carboxyvinyltransferase